MPRRVAVTGAAGQLGRQLVRTFAEAGDEVLQVVRPEWDIERADDLTRLAAWAPDVVINAAAWTDVDGCARDPERALRINGEAAGAVAAAAARAGALSVQISTNEVFDGLRETPYAEDDPTDPRNPYGASKLRGEELTRAANPRSIVVRTAWLFGPGGTNFVTKILAAADRARVAGEPLRVVDDEWGNPTWTPFLADDVRALVDVGAGGIYHLGGEPATSRLGWARTFLGETMPIESISMRDFQRASRVPPRAVLSTAKAQALGLPPRGWAAPSLAVAGERG
ncbi:MAG: dTDP-4-dehydrorhamnose reductase [Chloroflexota bacterium]